MLNIHRDHKRQKMTTEKLNTTTKKHKLTRVTETTVHRHEKWPRSDRITTQGCKMSKINTILVNQCKTTEETLNNSKRGRSALVSGLLWGGAGSQRHRSDMEDFYTRWTETGTNVWSSFLFICCDKMNFSGNQPGRSVWFWQNEHERVRSTPSHWCIKDE